MPRYDYRCDSCGEQFEVVQSFSEPALTTCPHCAAEGLKKVYGSVGVVFKGSGFYRTDSREARKKSTAAATAKSGDKPADKSADKAEGSGSSVPSGAPASSGSSPAKDSGGAKAAATASSSAASK